MPLNSPLNITQCKSACPPELTLQKCLSYLIFWTVRQCGSEWQVLVLLSRSISFAVTSWCRVWFVSSTSLGENIILTAGHFIFIWCTDEWSIISLLVTTNAEYPGFLAWDVADTIAFVSWHWPLSAPGVFAEVDWYWEYIPAFAATHFDTLLRLWKNHSCLETSICFCPTCTNNSLGTQYWGDSLYKWEI